jgi:hypothetical protein
VGSKGDASHTRAVHRHSAQLALPLAGAISVIQLRGVGDKERVIVAATRESADLHGDVQVVIGDVHEIVMSLLLLESWRALDRAREIRILRRKGSLPHVRELFQDIRHGVLVGVVVHEHNDAVVAEDHLAEGGPLVFVLRDELRGVEILRDSGVFDRGHEVFDEGEVGVSD